MVSISQPDIVMFYQTDLAFMVKSVLFEKHNTLSIGQKDIKCFKNRQKACI